MDLLTKVVTITLLQESIALRLRSLTVYYLTCFMDLTQFLTSIHFGSLQSQAHRRPNAMVQPREEESGWSATERALPQTPCRATPCALTREHSFARAPVTQTCPGPDGLDSSDSRSHRPGGWKQAWLLLRPLSLACGWPSSLCVCS